MSEIRIETDGSVRTVTLTRSEKRNAINEEMIAALHEAFAAPPPDTERVTVLRGEGPVFCSGLQLRSGGLDPDAAVVIEDMFNAVQHYPLPVVAVVQGAAIAGGCELALHCDFVVAEEEAAFAMPLAQLGVATTWFLTKKIMETAGSVAAREILLLGNRISGRRLFELGIIHQIATPDELLAAAGEVIGRLAANAPLSMRAMKAILVRQGAFLMDLDRGDTGRMVEDVYNSADAREGVTAWVEKRPPNFTGQ